MRFRTPADVREEFQAHPRRALVLTTVLCESQAVQAHLTKREALVGEKNGLYEYARFSDPSGDWVVVHALTAQGNSDAGLVTSKAFQEFGNFHVVMFVGVAGSLKEDIPIGSVVIGDHVYNGHSAKVEDKEILGRPKGLPAALELLTAAQGLIYFGGWIDLLRPPTGEKFPSTAEYPCNFPPLATIKGIVAGEEVVAGAKSPRFAFLRRHFNDCGAVEMEGWGVMKAARHENASAIIVRGISDMCAGKDHTKDRLHQPIAAAHAAAFAFGILSFRSKAQASEGEIPQTENSPKAAAAAEVHVQEERRVEFVFNFQGSKEDWTERKIETVVDLLRQATGDEKLQLVRVDSGSVRLIVSVGESTAAAIDLQKLREATAAGGAELLGAISSQSLREAEQARLALAAASVDLLAWERALPNGRWMERAEQESIEANFQLNSSSTVLLGEPGSGKSALLSKVASAIAESGAPVFAIKADFLSTDIRTESDLQHELQLPGLPSDLICRLAALQPVYVLIDQLDALASQLDLRSGRLNVLLNLVRRIGGVPNVHILLSARTFEFNHDVRLRAIDAEAISLALPPWHEVQAQLNAVGVDPDLWPEKAREVVRIPQALKTYIALVSAGRTEPFSTYQSMLEQLWHQRIVAADDSEGLISLVSDLASQMAEEEALWLAASRFDDRSKSLKRLEALGFVVRSENGLSVAFSHQTVFDYVLARTFVRAAGLLSTYVLSRQDSLFVRPKLWSALSYLREAELTSYEREFLAIWSAKDLRRHLRLLLIEFLGQVTQPRQFERVCMAEALRSKELHIFGLKAITTNSWWFSFFALTDIREAMLGTEAETAQAGQILASNWKTNGDTIVQLIRERWLPIAAKDTYSWITISECTHWTPGVEEIARVVLLRTSISTWQVAHAAMMLAVKQPDVAMRLVGAKLEYLLCEARKNSDLPPSPNEDATEHDKIAWAIRYRPEKPFEDLLDSIEWNDFPALAEAAPKLFLDHLFPWYVAVFNEILGRKGRESVKHIFPGGYALGIELTVPEGRAAFREKPIIVGLQTAVEELARHSADDFLKWADQNSGLELLPAQQLIARGYEVAADSLAAQGLEWLLADKRRFQLGTYYGHRSATIDLLRACVPYWTKEAIERFEKEAIGYRPEVPDHINDPEGRKIFADFVRASKKDLLQAVGEDRLTPESRELVIREQRALGDRFDRSIGEVQGGVIGSPMEAAAMEKAKDRDILKIFQEIPDNSDWDHPTDWMRGGNVQLSRAFAEFARTNAERAVRIMEQFEPLHQERAAGYALEAMAEDVANDDRIMGAFLDLDGRGFRAEEFRHAAARAVEKIAARKAGISEEVIGKLVEWLSDVPDSSEEEDKETNTDLISSVDGDGLKEGSILWGLGTSYALPGGNYNVLSALASVLLNMGEAGRDRFFAILDDYLGRERNPYVWKALLYRISNAGGTRPHVVSTFLRKLFSRFPGILATPEAVLFLAYAQRWDDQLVMDLIQDWSKSDRAFLQRAYGELVGLVSTAKATEHWVRARDEIIARGTGDAKIGLAHAAVNLWPDEKLRTTAGATLVSLLKGANKELVAAAMDVFRVTDELAPDASTIALLRALADPKTDMTAAPSHFVVERLQTLLPHCGELVAKVASNLVACWREQLGDARTEKALAAPQLTDLALTLHRLGGGLRDSGVALFELMLEIDAYGTRAALAEIDGRFGPQQAEARQRLTRRRRSRTHARGRR